MLQTFLLLLPSFAIDFLTFCSARSRASFVKNFGDIIC